MLLPQSDANNPSSSWIGMIKESIQKNSTDYAVNMILKCVKECESNIPIPDFFNLYNSEKLYHLEANIANYGTIAGTNAPPQHVHNAEPVLITVHSN